MLGFSPTEKLRIRCSNSSPKFEAASEGKGGLRLTGSQESLDIPQLASNSLSASKRFRIALSMPPAAL